MTHVRTTVPKALAVAASLTLLWTVPATTGFADDEEIDERSVHQRLHDCDSGDCPELLTLARRGGFLGVELQSLSAELRQHFNAPSDAGVMIAKVAEGSPAADAGLEVGDVIVAIDGESMSSGGEISRKVRRTGDGELLTFDVIRDAAPMELSVTIVERERASIDLGGYLGGLGVGGMHLEGLLDDARWERVGKEIEDAMSSIDWEEISASAQAISGEAMKEALAGIDKMFESEEWKEQMKRIEDIDYDGLEEQMEVLQKRLIELEARLEERLEDQ